MAEIEDNIRRSDAIQEIMGRNPAWIIRTGGVLLFLWLVTLIGLSLWIRYPEILSGTINITTYDPPMDLVAKSNGRISLLVSNDEVVEKGQVLGYIHETASFEEITKLDDMMGRFKSFVDRPDSMGSVASLPNFMNLGRVQIPFNAFTKALNQYNLMHQLNRGEVLVTHDRSQVSTLKQKEALLKEKENVLEQELAIAEKNFLSDKSLFERELISLTDFEVSQQAYLKAKKEVQNNQQAIVENRQGLQQLSYGISELSLNSQEQEEFLRESIRNSYKVLSAELEAYKQEYFLIAPISGAVSLFEFWNNNQNVQHGDKVAYIVVDSRDIVGKLVVNGNKFGKVEVGQKVRIKLNSYPMSEYGVLLGRVSVISKVNENNRFSVDVALDENPLVTTYNRKIPYSHEMLGVGEIVTKEYSLFERIVFHLRSLGQKEYTVDQGKVKGS